MYSETLVNVPVNNLPFRKKPSLTTEYSQVACLRNYKQFVHFGLPKTFKVNSSEVQYTIHNHLQHTKRSTPAHLVLQQPKIMASRNPANRTRASLNATAAKGLPRLQPCRGQRERQLNAGSKHETRNAKSLPDTIVPSAFH
jgi:hypothetical protein